MKIDSSGRGNRENITSRRNPLLQHIRKLLTNRSYREASGEFAADGRKLLEEAILWVPESLRTVLVTPDVDVTVPAQVRVVEVPYDIMQQVSPMETPQGVLFTCALPPRTEPVLTPRCLVLDGIQDPGNLGTILRTADALQTPVVLTPGCADAYNPKTVRASMGAVFRTPPQWAKQEDVVRLCHAKGQTLYVTALSPRAEDLRQVDLSCAAVVIGSEGRGAGEFFLRQAQGELIIPMNPQCESLNAAIAGAIVLWEMQRGG